MNENRNQNDDLSARLHDLIHASLNGTADEADHARLERLIVEIPQARSLYVRYIEDSVGLQLLAFADPTSEEPQGDLLVHNDPEFPLSEVVSPLIGEEMAATNTAVRKGRRRVPWRWTLTFTVLVAVLVCLTLILPLPRLFEQTGSTGSLQRVAQLRQATGVSWQHDGKSLSSVEGQWLMNGRYRLESGIVQMTFPWGTEAIFEGPAEFELQPNGRRKLLYGEMVARVPPNDTGFSVETQAVTVIDLGTEFGLLANRDGSCEVHVFQGEVEARGHNSGLAPHEPLKLTAGHATQFSGASSGDVDAMNVVYNPHRFSRVWQAANRIDGTTGAVRFVHPPPASVVPGAYESSSQVPIFLERQDVVLPTVTAVTLTQPGLYTSFSERGSWLPAGLKVDSYLIHFDPVGDAQTRPIVFAEGSVTFANPVIAVITRGDQLAASDMFCACPATSYFGSAVRLPGPHNFVAIRGLTGNWKPENIRSEPAPNDRIRLSPDCRTLTVQLAAGNETDQIRVLVASNREETSSLSWGDLSVSPPRPFLGRPFVVGEIIQAEHFDDGGDGVAYYDSTPTVLSSCYRHDSSIEILPFDKRSELGEFDQHGEVDYFVAYFRTGEWLGYSIAIAEPGDYVVLAKAASVYGGGQAHFEFGERYTTSPILVPKVKHQADFTWIKTDPLHLSPGRYFMRLVMDEPNSRGWIGDFDCFRIECADAKTTSEKDAVTTRPLTETDEPLRHTLPD